MQAAASITELDLFTISAHIPKTNVIETYHQGL
jgi:hypothetical protein